MQIPLGNFEMNNSYFTNSAKSEDINDYCLEVQSESDESVNLIEKSDLCYL